MLRLFALAFTLAVVSAGAAGAATAPSKATALAALRAKLHVTVLPAKPVCVSPGGSGVVWNCAYGVRHATISFRQVSGVWRATVWVR